VIISKVGISGQVDKITALLFEPENRANKVPDLFPAWPPEEEENVNRAVTGYDPKDQARICIIFQRLGFCDRHFCTKDHEILNPGKKNIFLLQG